MERPGNTEMTSWCCGMLICAVGAVLCCHLHSLCSRSFLNFPSLGAMSDSDVGNEPNLDSGLVNLM